MPPAIARSAGISSTSTRARTIAAFPGAVTSSGTTSFRRCADINYDGWLTIESFGFALGDLSAAAAIWRDIEETPESIAIEGIKFLKGEFGR